MDYKLGLIFVLQGSAIMSSQECDENPKENYVTEKVMVSEITGKGRNKKLIAKPIYIKVRKPKTVIQRINANKEAYLHMLNTPTNAGLAKIVRVDKKTGAITRAWDLLSEDERLKRHLDTLAHDLHALSYRYEVMQD